jgi:hypothetical protein
MAQFCLKASEMKDAVVLCSGLLFIVASALPDDFKTYNGKEYKNAKVTRVEPDGIVVATKQGISKLYFIELPEDVQKQFRYDPEKAAAYGAQQAAAQHAAAQQVEESSKQQSGHQNQLTDQAAKQQNIQALINTYQALLQQEEDLLVQIGQIKNAQESARRKWAMRSWGQNEPQTYQYQTDSAEANLPLLEGRLENVRGEKNRVRDELDRAQHQR